MTPVERVEAAILRLETLQADSTPGPWKKEESPCMNGAFDVLSVFGYVSYGDVGALENETDADLIATLHSTVDPMLAILRDTLDLFRDPILIFMGREEQVFAAQLALADSILGAPNE